MGSISWYHLCDEGGDKEKEERGFAYLHKNIDYQIGASVDYIMYTDKETSQRKADFYFEFKKEYIQLYKLEEHLRHSYKLTKSEDNTHQEG
jgi:hypothetical protein